MDAQTGRVLYEKNADEQSLIASTTKIMTGLLVCEAGELEREISVPPEAAGVEGSSLYLKAGERITVRELLYGLMLRSGNDAAVALAIATAGSMEAFVGRMNEKAQALGLTNTHFENPNGLDGEVHYSTARSGKAQRLRDAERNVPRGRLQQKLHGKRQKLYQSQQASVACGRSRRHQDRLYEKSGQNPCRKRSARRKTARLRDDLRPRRLARPAGAV